MQWVFEWGIVAAAVLAQSSQPASTATKPAVSSELQLLQEAFQGARADLTSGAGSGWFRQFERKPAQSEWKMVADAALRTYLKDAKYHVDLEYKLEPIRVKRRIIIFDESAVFAARFSDSISETRAETMVFDASPTPSGMVRPQMAGFPWDVTNLASNLVNIPRLVGNLGADKILLTGSPEKGFRGEYPSGRSGRVIFECPAKFGYNVASKVLTVEEGGRTETRQSFRAEWAQVSDVWYIKSFEEEQHLPDKSTRWAFQYDSFEPNAQVADKLFTLAALEMPGGTRIVDQRGSVELEDRFHFVPVDDASMEVAMNKMVDQLKSMPTREGRPDKFGSFPDRIGWLLVNGVCLALLLALFLWRKRGRSEQNRAN